ncbi:MAG TPA: DUF2231 domain-containing protein [Egibacteraceae bacterium]|jgi:uncharacterized membrane protein|nr:DUF2231 domain-containing protein [Egibacteraceae bacterium]
MVTPTPTDLHHHAKRPVTVAAGPYGHPFHPIFVTVPIGAWVASLVFDLASFWAEDPQVFTTGALWLIAVGIIGAVVAALFGLLDLVAIPRGTKAFRTGLIHMGLNLTVVVLFAAGFFLRMGVFDQAPVAPVPLAVSAGALLLLMVSGWLGGKLAYTYGVRVADEQEQTSGYTA